MNLNKKYIIGTHVMFYEIEMISEFVDSVINSCELIDNKTNVTVDLFFNMSEFFERIDETQITKKELINKFMVEVNRLNDLGVNVTHEVYEKNELYTIGSYRRDLNYKNCNEYDFVVWGESDCLIPKEFFTTLETVSNYTDENNIHRYITTFATRKMWDSSWSILEHNDFVNSKFYDMKEEGWKTDKSSIWYTMSIDEMDEINQKSDDLDIRVSNEPKFDGSLLVISSDLIRSGVNIPHSCYACGEDASFERMCKIIMGKSYVQFIVKNILKVHNRVHPKKREYVLGEKDFENVKQKRKSNNRWQQFHKICEHNLYSLGENQTKFKSVKDLD
jgi:hypothetical protein|tara:strand:+ start:1422 stop:2417 length:996 start_codon:yes stop_codon:yes gene_type:complete